MNPMLGTIISNKAVKKMSFKMLGFWIVTATALVGI